MRHRTTVPESRHARLSVMLGMWAAGCGAQTEPHTPPPAAASSGAETFVVPRGGGMQVEGILGTIPQRRIEERLQAELPTFQRCFYQGAGVVPALSGYMHFYFRVGLDGRVEWVQPHRSSVGHRETELCLLTHAKHVRFPQPKGGGPAEFAWGFEFEAAEDVKKPVAWPAERVTSVLEQHRAELAACNADPNSHYAVTLYVGAGGKVQAAGGAMGKPAATDQLECIVATVSSWEFPDPSPDTAKVSIPL